MHKILFNKERFDGLAQGIIDGFQDAFKKNGLEEYIPEFLQKVTNKKILHSNKILNDTIKKEKMKRHHYNLML